MDEAPHIAVKLSVRRMGVAYNGHQVFDGLDFDLRVGETLAILGRSAAGKSTLLRCIAGLQIPQRGDAFFDGRKYLSDGMLLMSEAELRPRISVVFQGYNLFPNMTVSRNIALALERVQKISRPEAMARAERVAELLGIATVLKRFPAELSGGQAQRVAIARALALQPQVLLLDEVTSAVDPETKHTVMDALRNVRGVEEQLIQGSTAARVSILLVTHEFRFAESFANRIAFLTARGLIEDHPAGSFFEASRDADVRKYLERVL